jgi:hypothetical protein
MTALLGQIGRREVHHHALARQAQPGRGQRGAHALAGFLDGLVGQADNDESGKARRELRLHIHRHRLDALERHGLHPRHHAQPPQPALGQTLISRAETGGLCI